MLVVKRTHCDVPMDIPNGNWITVSQFTDFRIGVRVKYECEGEYKPIGPTEIECLSTGYWSEYPPRCLVKGKDMFMYVTMYVCINGVLQCCPTCGPHAARELIFSGPPEVPKFLQFV